MRQATDEVRVVKDSAPAVFDGIPASAQSVSRTLLPSFERYTDTLKGTASTRLRFSGYHLKRLTPAGIAYKADELEDIADARHRNEPAHEYPGNLATRLDRFPQALDALSFLDDATARIRRFAGTRMIGLQP